VKAVVVGAGVGGLVAALELARQGVEVTLLERASAPGGKMREVAVGGEKLDGGPTVFTMRWVFDEIFAAAGASLSDHLTLRKADVLARHAWRGAERLDLFADIDRSADAIGVFAGAKEARGFREFSARARDMYRILRDPFIRAPLPSQAGLVRAAGLLEMMRVNPFQTMWRGLEKHFADPRLRQLFGRYATYCGSSPFLAPATLMLVAHVEQDGVWLVEGGMHRVAAALADLARAKGVTVRHGAHVAEVLVDGGRACGVRLADGERIAAAVVVLNADAGALGAGLFGRSVAQSVAPVPAAERSLSALTWCTVARAEGFPLARHTVFFGGAAYASEFDDVFTRRRLPADPTVYVCAQDRDDAGAGPDGPERLLILVNAPPDGDRSPPSASEIDACLQRTTARLASCGLTLRTRASQTTGPAEFETLFPATGGALYGRAVHGSQATFRRPGSRSRMPGLYLAGGSAHPGAGVPMAALSGRLAAAAAIADLASTSRSRAPATSGGTSTR
jgi:1-hydroxycarotenoid 3,4-desaturase